MEPKREGGRRVLQTIELVALIFFSVSGGSYGSEGLIKSAGPFYTLIAFAIVPFFWCVPIALMTAELSTTFPTDGGPCVWVKHAMGDFWAYQQGWWDWYSGVVDNAIYPVLMLDYLEQLLSVKFIWWHAVLIKVFICLLLTFLQFRGLEVVGWTSVAIVFSVLIPYLILIVMALKYVQPVLWLEKRPDIRWAHFINILLWNLNSWESVSSLAGEVENPNKAFPRATFISIVLIILNYIIPLSVAYCADPVLKHWKDGHFSAVSQMVGGAWLGYLFLIGAILSGSAQFLAEMASDSYQLMGMAKWGMLPRVFGKTHNRFGTPTFSIMCSFVMVLPVTLLNLGDIVQIENTLYSLSLMAECTAMVILRYKEPHLNRPYKLPLSNRWLAVYLCFPVGLGIFSMVMCDAKTWIITGIAIVVGLISYLVIQYMKETECCQFETLLSLGDFRDNSDEESPSKSFQDSAHERPQHAPPTENTRITSAKSSLYGSLNDKQE